MLTLTSVHPDEGGSIDQLEEGVTTLMNAARAPGLTYVLIRATEDRTAGPGATTPSSTSTGWGATRTSEAHRLAAEAYSQSSQVPA